MKGEEEQVPGKQFHSSLCQACSTYERLDGGYNVGRHCPSVTEGETEEQRRGAWPRSPRSSVLPGSLLPAKPLPGDPGGWLTPPGEAHGSPHGAQPLEGGVVQLRSDVQMLYLQARENTQLPTSLPPHSSLRASAPDLLYLVSIGHSFPLPLDPQRGDAGHLRYRAMGCNYPPRCGSTQV